MAFAVFLQFFTRYVLNDSLAWTEEIATYCLGSSGVSWGRRCASAWGAISTSI